MERAALQDGGSVNIRFYNPEKDRHAVHRIWREVGWIEDERDEKAMDIFLESGFSVIGEVDGQAECMVNTDAGTLQYLEAEVPATLIDGVTTSRIARKRGFAQRLTAHAIASEAHSGADVAVLGVFEQGFYNRLGFGNGSYEYWCTFDPAQLVVPVDARAPTRLTSEDWEAVHASRRARLRWHGACSFHAPEFTHADMLWSDNGFGLGYFDDTGDLTHHLWCSVKDVEGGPYRVSWMAYRSRDQFLELLSLLRSLGDQVRSVRLHEPGGVQLQDVLRDPFKTRQITRRSPHENKMTASAYWQARILNLKNCLEMTHLEGEPVSFNLALTDPIEAYLPGDSVWRGIAGDYVVTLGPTSGAVEGTDASLPTLGASVNAFTRMWLAVRPASRLGWTDELSGPPDLIWELDHALRLPRPSSDWDF
jgi:hypothetical protein